MSEVRFAISFAPPCLPVNWLSLAFFSSTILARSCSYSVVIQRAQFARRIETIKGLPRGRWYALATPRRRSVRSLAGGCLLRSRAPRILRLELPFHRRRRDDDAAQSLPQAERGTPHTAGGVSLMRLLQTPRRSRGGEMRTLRGSAATVSRSEEHTSELQSPM